MSDQKIITSFDIGIRNLAYCTMEYQPNNIPGNQFKIHDWNVIDLLEESGDQEKKCQIHYKSGQKNGQLCGKKAHYYVCGIDGKTISVCKVHSKSYSSQQLKRMYTVANINLHELARLAVKKLDKIDFSSSQEVVFESQPRKNPKMKNFSMMLFNYFVIRYIAEKPEHLQTLTDVKFISSRNKLTVYDGPYIECKLKNQHSRNKFYGKEYCKYIIRFNNEKLQFFNGFKKRDDLADSFLQGAWYLMSNYKSSNLVSANKIKIKLNKNFLKSEENDEKSDDDFSDEDDDEENEENEEECDNIEIKPKIMLKKKLQISLKPTLVGKEQLMSIKKSETTKKLHIDYNANKYKQLKRGYKPKDTTSRYTLSNIKYVIDKNNLSTIEKIKQFSNNDPLLISSIKYYFNDIDNFNKALEK